MLKCRDVSELATDYMEDALSPRRRLAMRFHLMICSMCRAYMDQLSKTRQLLGRGRLPPPEPEREAALLAAAARGDVPPGEPPA